MFLFLSNLSDARIALPFPFDYVELNDIQKKVKICLFDVALSNFMRLYKNCTRKPLP